MSGIDGEVNQYLESLEGVQKEWMSFFVNYMRGTHPELEEVISFKMPTYKLGSGKERNYIAFSPAKGHFSMHTLDFDYIGILKQKLAKPGKGKGCVNVAYACTQERDLLLHGIEEIVNRSRNAG